MTASPTVPFEGAGGTKLADEIEALGQRLHAVRESIGRVIFGQQRVVDQTLITLLAGGHALVIGVPGLAKTLLVETLGVVFGLEDKRVQCTPDLMPADILGSEVLEESDTGRRSFRFIAGPVFCQLLMADEINRASPRTQSALLQAMQERRVTVAGQTHDLPRPFHVLATQNPLELEGTYPLPEAQLDRFLLKVVVMIWFQMLIRWSMPRFRYDQVMNLGWKILLPLSLANIVITALALLLIDEIVR